MPSSSDRRTTRSMTRAKPATSSDRIFRPSPKVKHTYMGWRRRTIDGNPVRNPFPIIYEPNPNWVNLMLDQPPVAPAIELVNDQNDAVLVDVDNAPAVPQNDALLVDDDVAGVINEDIRVRVVSQQLDAKGKRVDVPDEWEPQERFYGNEFKKENFYHLSYEQACAEAAAAHNQAFEHKRDVDKAVETMCTCPVCLGLAAIPRVLVECGHVVCQPCIQDIFNSTKIDNTCPICRHDITKEPVICFVIRDVVASWAKGRDWEAGPSTVWNWNQLKLKAEIAGHR